MEDVSLALPLWVDIMISLLGAFSGLELIKFLYEVIFNRKANKKKTNAEASQVTAEANSADVDYRQKEMELLTMQTEFNKQQFENLKHEYEDLANSKTEMVNNYRILKNNYIELVRKVNGLQAAFNQAFSIEVKKKKEAEKNCCFRNCTNREPAKGTYSTETIELKDIFSTREALDLFKPVEE